MKPLILVAGSIKKSEDKVDYVVRELYGAAVERAGGISAMRLGSGAADFGERFDGLIISGGGDVSPELYGEAVLNEKVEPEPERDDVEMRLLSEFMRLGKPVFGICRGLQIINVFFGGTLWQDLPEQKGVSHSDTEHNASAVVRCVLTDIIGAKLKVNSFHHQAVKDAGRGLFEIYRSDDGICEGLMHESLPVFGLQWHPERMIGEGGFKDLTPVFEYFLRGNMY